MTFMLLLFTGGCAFSDLTKRRISNRLILFWGLFFFLFRLSLGVKTGLTGGLGGAPPGLGTALIAGLSQGSGYLLRVGLMLCVLFPLYLFRMMGAGDIKMAAVLVGTAGMHQGGKILLCGLFVAGIWSFVQLWRRGLWRRRLRYLAFYLRQLSPGETVEPYYLEERDGKEAAFCLAPCLFLGVIGAEVFKYL